MTHPRRRIYTLLEQAERGDRASLTVDVFLIGLILANVLAMMLETLPELRSSHAGDFRMFEALSVGIFTLEYLLRIWSHPVRAGQAIRGRLRLMLRPMLLIDLAAILPFYIGLIGLGLDFRMLRMLRLFRLTRLGKLARYSQALRLLGRGILGRKEELLITLMVSAFVLVCSAVVMFYVEHEAQPAVFPSIPSTLWWAITTLTTVGYGDAYPVTIAGKVVGGFVQIMGVGLFAIPAGLLGASFLQQLDQQKAAPVPKQCPHCGRPLTG